MSWSLATNGNFGDRQWQIGDTQNFQFDPDNSGESPMTRDTQKARTRTMKRHFISWATIFLATKFATRAWHSGRACRDESRNKKQVQNPHEIWYVRFFRLANILKLHNHNADCSRECVERCVSPTRRLTINAESRVQNEKEKINPLAAPVFDTRIVFRYPIRSHHNPFIDDCIKAIGVCVESGCLCLEIWAPFHVRGEPTRTFRRSKQI